MAVETEREKLEPDLERIARASLKELGDIRIDDVLSFIDRGIENMPSYMDLYRRWESQQWAVGDLDFSLYRQDWPDARDLTQLLKEIRPDTNEGYNELFYDRLPATSQRLASNPRDFDAFVEGITLYHIVIEATLALTGQRFELESMREMGTTDRGF